MNSAVEKLTSLAGAKDCYDIPHPELLPMQIEAADERLKSRGAIRLLAHRAETAGIKTIRKAADLLPLLFAHTAYKSYPESWFTQGKWDRMGQWLDTVSSHRVRGIDNEGVEDVDGWIERLAAAGHFMSCSSGTTGKCSMLTASMVDREVIKRYMTAAFEWATKVPPRNEYRFVGAAPMVRNFRAIDAGDSVKDIYCDGVKHEYAGPPITVGQVSRMVAMRRDIANGTARPAEIAEFEATSKARQAAMEEAKATAVRLLIEYRGKKLMIGGMTGALFEVSEAVRAAGYGAKDFHPENIIQTAGGLKGAVVPPDYRERILETFNVSGPRVYQFYSMQEVNTPFPPCSVGRYHIPPWVMLLLLDEGGDNLIEPTEGEIEGRAGFFDISLDGRWGGIISGDRVKVDYGQCACGHQGPTVNRDIVRYSDLPGGDKISCAGTIDAYVRGAA
jgi:hypothetical protein